MTKRISRLCVMVGVVAAIGGASAGVALPDPGNAQGNGPGPCIVPGTLINQLAKGPGSTKDAFGGIAPGQLVSSECTPAGS
jgi:hypothetical protein